MYLEQFKRPKVTTLKMFHLPRLIGGNGTPMLGNWNASIRCTERQYLCILDNCYLYDLLMQCIGWTNIMKKMFLWSNCSFLLKLHKNNQKTNWHNLFFENVATLKTASLLVVCNGFTLAGRSSVCRQQAEMSWGPLNG